MGDRNRIPGIPTLDEKVMANHLAIHLLVTPIAVSQPFLALNIAFALSNRDIEQRTSVLQLAKQI